MSASSRVPHGYSAAFAWCFCIEVPGITSYDRVCERGFWRVQNLADAQVAARMVAEHCDQLTLTQCIHYLQFKRRCMELGVLGEILPLLQQALAPLQHAA